MISRRHPKVSILLPARDAADTLSACLRSLARQTEADWECIAIDDGSSDATGEMLRACGERDQRVRVLAGAGSGLVDALMLGLSHCRAPLIARMDADDWMHSARLESQIARLEAEPDLAAVGSHVRSFPRAALTDGRRRYEDWLNSLGDRTSISRNAWVECPVAHPTLMIRSEILRELGYRRMGWAEDYDLLLRLLAAGHSVAVVERRLLGWRDSATRLSRNNADYSLERFVDCKATHLANAFLSDRKHYVLWGYGPTARALRRALARLDVLPSHIVELHPRRIGQTIHGAPVIEPEALSHVPSPRIVSAVSGAGPRARIREWLDAHGFVESVDYVCAA